MQQTLLQASLSIGLLLGAAPAQASVGLAEWEIATPGGNAISSRDPLKAEHGCALHDKDGESVFVSHLETWRFHKGYVAGKDKVGYFLFREADGHIDRLSSMSLLVGLITQRKIGRATSRWMTPADGWKQSNKHVH